MADAKGEQLDQFINELRSKETEIQLLRQSLDRTREALLNEQRSVATFKKSRVSFDCKHMLAFGQCIIQYYHTAGYTN